MVKLFVGNIADGLTSEELRGYFEEHGKVTECDILGTFGFVHMDSESEAQKAITNLNKKRVHGKELHVETSKSGSGGKGGRGGGGRGVGRGGGGNFGGRGGGRGGGRDNAAARRAGCIKLHVANLAEGLREQDLQFLFERYGFVAECDILADKKIAFVHIEAAGAQEAINALNGRNFQGMPLKVQMSKNQNNAAVMGANMGGPMNFRGGFRGGMRGQGGMGFGGRNSGGGFGGGSLLAAGGYNFGSGDGYDLDATDPFDDINLPPVAKDRMELLELLDRRRRLEALDPYEVELIQSVDPFNLPPPPPEYLRLLRERAMVKARLPLPSASPSLDRSRNMTPSASAASNSSVTRALIARRAAAVAASAREKLRSAALDVDSYDDNKNGSGGMDDFMYGAGMGY